MPEKIKKEMVAATRNRGKLEELKRILEGSGVGLLGLDDFPGCPEVEETGSTFKENATMKALAVARFTGLPALADDSGLEVYALGDAPGVYSARYAGEGATDKDNVHKLLKELADVADQNRGARFVCVIALAYPDGTVKTFEGHVGGRIGREPRGSSGFGYDPLFYPNRTESSGGPDRTEWPGGPERHERTFAEMSAPEKDSMSHRGRALLKLKAYFSTLTGR